MKLLVKQELWKLSQFKKEINNLVIQQALGFYNPVVVPSFKNNLFINKI